MKSRLGWKPQLPDFRDKKYALKRSRAALPRSVELITGGKMPPVVNQVQTNSCTGHAGQALVDFLHPDPEYKSGIFMPSSRRFLYWRACEIGGFAGQDEGAYIRDMMKGMKEGVPHELACRFSEAKIATKPNKIAFTQAERRRKIGSYHPLETTDDMRSCLAEGFPFVFGISVYSKFFSDNTSQAGEVDMPGVGETLEGGHAMLCCGYDDSVARFLFRNSWGEGWGVRGYGTIPYAYLADSNLAGDFMTARL
ncbi:MAG: C1 family peptidase [Caldimonas sp.]